MKLLPEDEISKYEPRHSVKEFHENYNDNCFIIGNRKTLRTPAAGKTWAAAIEFSKRVLGMGVPDHLVSSPEHPLNFYVCGWDSHHTGIMRKLLFDGYLKAPTIPSRFIVDQTGKNDPFWRVTLSNKADIIGFPSGTTPRVITPVAGIWIDEDIQNPNVYGEYLDRLVDYRGWMIWSIEEFPFGRSDIRYADYAEESAKKAKVFDMSHVP